MTATNIDIEASRPRSTGAITGLWILNGFLWFAFCVYAWGRWVFGRYFVQNTIGRDLAPTWYVNLVHGVEIFAAVVTVFILWTFVFRPWFRTGKLTFDALFFLSCWSLFIQEPWINYTGLQFLYSTVFVNFGCWCVYIPGWSAPNPEKIPVALAWGTAYLWLVAVPSWTGSLLIGWLRRKYPDFTIFQILCITFMAFVLFDCALEGFIVRTDLFNYGSTVRSLTLFAGTKYQFPIYEVASWCATYTGLACIHHFRNANGQSYPERGNERFKISGAPRTFIRFLAIMGACQMVMFVTYNIPYQFWALHAGPIPAQFELFRTAGVCGVGTNYDCPAPGVPIATRSSPTNRIAPPPAPATQPRS